MPTLPIALADARAHLTALDATWQELRSLDGAPSADADPLDARLRAHAAEAWLLAAQVRERVARLEGVIAATQAA